MTLTESVPDGWWYSALLPKNVRAVSFFTDSNTTIARSAKSRTGWKALLHDTKYIKLNLEEYKYDVVSGPYTVMSNSSRLKKAIGEDWLAVGDAAATYDPISSMGITTAITDGINASNTIMKHLNGNRECIQQYNKNIIAAFNEYLKKRTYYYKLENRWPWSFGYFC
jgi:flavin-dependent dehydrogenase